MAEGFFLDLTVVLVLAASLGLVTHLLRQPPLLGYILTGVLLGSFGLWSLTDVEIFRSLAQVGVALLLFMVGLEMNIRDLKSVGIPSLITGAGQILFTTVLGVMIARALGFSLLAATYIALALSFSSTIIIVKLLSQKQDLGSLYGKISVGFLLVQDFVAIIALVLLSGLTGAGGEGLDIMGLVLLVGKTVLLVGNVIILSQTLIPYLVNRLARSPELLFVTSLAWAFAVAAFTASPLIGFSIEIGGFLAGLALANSVEHLQIASRIRPLRDFFILLFFVLLGLQLGFGGLEQVWVPALIFSAFVLLGNPLIILVLMALLGYRRRTSFLAGLTVAQISEFSLILIALGIRLGHLPSETLTMFTLVAIVTMTASAYLILEGDRVFRFLRPMLTPFERRKTVEARVSLSNPLKGHTVLIGGHRTAENILKALRRRDGDVLVVDYDPTVVDRLEKEHIPVLFGDIADPDIRAQAGLEEAKLIISTISDPADTKRFLEDLQHRRRGTSVIVTAQNRDEATEFYRMGADYVLLPHFVSGEHVADLLASRSLARRLAALKTEHSRELSQSLSG